MKIDLPKRPDLLSLESRVEQLAMWFDQRDLMQYVRDNAPSLEREVSRLVTSTRTGASYQEGCVDAIARKDVQAMWLCYDCLSNLRKRILEPRRKNGASQRAAGKAEALGAWMRSHPTLKGSRHAAGKAAIVAKCTPAYARATLRAAGFLKGIK
jgi:hypothetical protein